METLPTIVYTQILCAAFVSDSAVDDGHARGGEGAAGPVHDRMPLVLLSYSRATSIHVRSSPRINNILYRFHQS